MSTKPYEPYLLNDLKNITVAVEFLSSSLSSLALDEYEIFLDVIRNVEQALPDCQISFEKITDTKKRGVFLTNTPDENPKISIVCEEDLLRLLTKPKIINQ